MRWPRTSSAERDIAARPTKYARPSPRPRPRRRPSYATRTMRWGGVILGLFLVWHILDLTTLTVNPRAEAGHPYANVVATFSTWYGTTVYLVAMLALGLHIRHGFWSAAQTLGAVARPRPDPQDPGEHSRRRPDPGLHRRPRLRADRSSELT